MNEDSSLGSIPTKGSNTLNHVWREHSSQLEYPHSILVYQAMFHCFCCPLTPNWWRRSRHQKKKRQKEKKNLAGCWTENNLLLNVNGNKVLIEGGAKDTDPRLTISGAEMLEGNRCRSLAIRITCHGDLHPGEERWEYLEGIYKGKIPSTKIFLNFCGRRIQSIPLRVISMGCEQPRTGG